MIQDFLNKNWNVLEKLSEFSLCDIFTARGWGWGVLSPPSRFASFPLGFTSIEKGITLSHICFFTTSPPPPCVTAVFPLSCYFNSPLSIFFLVADIRLIYLFFQSTVHSLFFLFPPFLLPLVSVRKEFSEINVLYFMAGNIVITILFLAGNVAITILFWREIFNDGTYNMET